MKNEGTRFAIERAAEDGQWCRVLVNDQSAFDLESQARRALKQMRTRSDDAGWRIVPVHEPRTVSPSRRTTTLQRTAYHEAGHAVAAVRLGLSFRTVTIEPLIERGKFVRRLRAFAKKKGIATDWVQTVIERRDELLRARGEDYLGKLTHSSTRAFLRAAADGHAPTAKVEAHVVVSLAGPEAEKQYCGRYNDGGARFDLDAAVALLEKHIGSTLELNAWLNLQTIRAQQAVRVLWSQIDAVAQQLLQQSTLTREEVRSLCARATRAT